MTNDASTPPHSFQWRMTGNGGKGRERGELKGEEEI